MRERLAALARARLRDILDLLALRADAIGEVLAAEQGLVAWDRAAILGHAQRQLRRLLEAPEPVGGEAVGVVLERRRQPLECLAPAWGALLRGARVHVGGEAGATRVGVELLGELAERLEIDGAPAYRLALWAGPRRQALRDLLRAHGGDLLYLHGRLARLRGARLWLNGWCFASDGPWSAPRQVHLVRAWIDHASSPPAS
ncbi:MAG: hypothetical protein KC486_25590 [Myxococcales bacterium]|nr:hypothetical protein [Myxococcales bacterium]